MAHLETDTGILLGETVITYHRSREPWCLLEVKNVGFKMAKY